MNQASSRPDRARWILALALAAALVLAGGLPAWRVAQVQESARARWGLDRIDRHTAAWLAGLAGVYVLALGTAFGSFLGVVAYRVPRHLSLLWPPSRCEGCQQAIRPRDNLPVLGWILLGGRCRWCGQQLSLGHPLVELGCGLGLWAMVAATLLSWGGNLPEPASALPATPESLGGWLTVSAYFAALAAWLVAWSRMVDSPPPAGYWAWGGVIAFGPPLVAAGLVAWGWLPGPAESAPGLGRIGIGLGLGAILGACGALAFGPPAGSSAPNWQLMRSLAGALALCGAALGWPAAVSLLLIWALARLALAGGRRVAPGWSSAGDWADRVLLPVALVVQVTLGRTLAEARFWPGGKPNLAAALASLAGLALLLRLAGRIHQPRPRRGAPPPGAPRPPQAPSRPVH